MSIHIKMGKLWHIPTNVYHAMVKKIELYASTCSNNRLLSKKRVTKEYV